MFGNRPVGAPILHPADGGGGGIDAVAALAALHHDIGFDGGGAVLSITQVWSRQSWPLGTRCGV
jgi:hypothetical protein